MIVFMFEHVQQIKNITVQNMHQPIKQFHKTKDDKCKAIQISLYDIITITNINILTAKYQFNTPPLILKNLYYLTTSH